MFLLINLVISAVKMYNILTFLNQEFQIDLKSYLMVIQAKASQQIGVIH